MSTILRLIGGNGGDRFSLTGRTNGASLQKIWVWVGPSQVKAVRVWLSDGQNKTYGEPEGEHTEYIFQPGEKITSLSLWGNGNGTRLGGIKFKTDQSKDFFVKMTSWGLKTEYPIDVGSGICLGVEGRSGCDIDCMGFVFLNNIKSVVLTNVRYPTIDQVTPQVALEDIKSVKYKNKSSVRQPQKVEASKTITNTSSWSMSSNIAATLNMEVKAGIPGIGEASTGLKTTVGQENTYSREYSSEKTEAVSINIDVPPKKKVNVKITVGRCTFDLPYTGTVRMTCTNDSVFSFQTTGQYKGVTYTDLNTDIKQKDIATDTTDTKEKDIATDIKEKDIATDTKEKDIATDIKEKDIATDTTDTKEKDIATDTTDTKEKDIATDTTDTKEKDIATDIKEKDIATDTKEKDIATDIKEKDIATDTKEKDIATDIKEKDIKKFSE